MDTMTAIALGFGGATLVLLILQQLFFALAVTALLREGRVETAQALGALRETLTRRLEEVEARLRAMDAERATPQGPEARCRRASTMEDDQSTPKVVRDIELRSVPEKDGRPPAQRNKAPSPSSAAEAPRAGAPPKASAPERLHRRSPSTSKNPSTGDVETPRSVLDRPSLHVSSGRLQGAVSSQSSFPESLEGAPAATAPPRAKKRRSTSTSSTPAVWPRGFPTIIRSGTRPVSSGSLFYANVVDKMRREASASR